MRAFALAALLAAASPAGAASLRAPAFLTRIGRLILPPTVPTRFDDGTRSEHFYHGTSVAALARSLGSGAALKPEVTFVSNRAWHPYGYARAAARRDRSWGVLLQFERVPLEDSVVPGHYDPPHIPGLSGEEQARFYRAVRPLPLRAQTEASKESLLAWLREQRGGPETPPDGRSWDELLASFEAALK